MNYVERAREALHEALRAQGKDPASSLTPALEQLYVLLVLTLGEAVGLQDVHDAWAVARAVERPNHPDLVPFDQLPLETQDYDIPFVIAIQAARRRLTGEKARG